MAELALEMQETYRLDAILHFVSTCIYSYVHTNDFHIARIMNILADCSISNVQMLKYPNIWMFQTSAKSLPSIKICEFCSNLEKVDMFRQAVFCPNFVSTPTSAKLPNIQIYCIHVHTLGDQSQQSIC